MAFVFEKVPEKDWELFNSFQLKINDRAGILHADKYTWWVVDREREIYFICLKGGALERPAVYEIIWRGKKIRFHVEKKVQVTESSKALHWNITYVCAPKSLESNKNEIISLIKERAFFNQDDDFVLEKIAEPYFI